MAARPLASISRTRRPTATSALTAGLAPATLTTLGLLVARLVPARLTRAADGADVMGYPPLARLLTRIVPNMEKIGRAAGRERVGQYVEISGVAVSLKKKKKKSTD